MFRARMLPLIAVASLSLAALFPLAVLAQRDTLRVPRDSVVSDSLVRESLSPRFRFAVPELFSSAYLLDAYSLVTAQARDTSFDYASGLVELADGSRWEIYLPDAPTADSWTPGSLIQVRARPAPIGEFDYVLLNPRERSWATARFRGLGTR